MLQEPQKAKMVKVKGKGHPRTGHEGPEGEWMYSSTLSSTSALDGVDGQHHAPATLPPGTMFIVFVLCLS